MKNLTRKSFLAAIGATFGALSVKVFGHNPKNAQIKEHKLELKVSKQRFVKYDFSKITIFKKRNDEIGIRVYAMVPNSWIEFYKNYPITSDGATNRTIYNSQKSGHKLYFDLYFETETGFMGISHEKLELTEENLIKVGVPVLNMNYEPIKVIDYSWAGTDDLVFKACEISPIAAKTQSF